MQARLGVADFGLQCCGAALCGVELAFGGAQGGGFFLKLLASGGVVALGGFELRLE